MQSMNKVLKNYFEYFSNKDLDSLEPLFAEDVVLVDWNVTAFGKNNVLLANKNIFDSVETIKIFVSSVYKNPKDKSFLCLIDIVINNNELIKVSDYIKFDEHGLIKSVEACLLNPA